MSTQNDRNEIRKIIDRIEKKSANSDYIYRGEPKRHTKVSSSLYRQYAKEIVAEHFDIKVVQDEMLTEAERYVYEKDGFEILTQLQHYGGKTNLIDFTNDYLVALFFACDGFPNSGGRVILLEKNESTKDYIKEPQSPINRVRDQKSVFVQPPKGFIERGPYKVINIPKHLKQPMLDHLEKYHGISASVIYNDLHGFIRVQDLHQSAYAEFFKGLTCQDRGDDEKAVEHYTKALELNKQLVFIYNNRGIAYGNMGNFGRAIVDLTVVIQQEPDYAKAYNNRGNAYRAIGAFDRAIADYNTVIKKKPSFAASYYNRGIAWLHLEEWGKARSDLMEAKNMGINIINLFGNGYESVSHFEGINRVELPEDIAEMLTPTQS
ncbi:tetratricopeptide repeat protein [Candidatus Poribacteria bacterium]|nr:tetratricopeptide repeat protein [Candidatus Poribacteria bacterium]